jgi:Ni,Fe-hydrogenase III small subunit/Pyruvate/2-oxoacid:ferredoxin oxidoreductase delta subunit
MFDPFLTRAHFGNLAIKNIKKAEVKEKFRGLPVISNNNCGECVNCRSVCPVSAIELEPLKIDMGKCIFCGDCERECKNNNIKFSTFHKIGTTDYKGLIIDAATDPKTFKAKAIKINKKIKDTFGHSLALRSVSAGGCGGCELELNACSNINFDMGRFGITITASPRHADGIIITGPVTENMSAALSDAYSSVPEPKIIILAGSCAISGGLFAESEALNRSFIEKHKIDLYLPGCPIHPLTLINGILDMLGGK